MEKLFKLQERGTDVKTEIMAGITTFMAMAYILAVNPQLLSASGMDSAAIFAATAIASALASFCMAFMANLPFVLSAGMGLNAYFSYTVVLGMGYSWHWALAAIFAEGIIFIILSITNVREAIFNSIPANLKAAVSVGIGLFIAFIGFQNAKIVQADPSTLVKMFSWKNAETPFSTYGITVLLALIGVLVIAFLLVKNVKGGVLWGILVVWLAAVILELVGVYVPDNETFFSVIPSFKGGLQNIGNIKLTFGQCFTGLKEVVDGAHYLDFVLVLFSFLFVDLFDTLGTIIGVATQADMLDSEGKLPSIKGALLADAIGTTAGAILGTSTITTFVESASGVSEGGRTGLTALVAGILFLLSLLLSPIFLAIPSFATAPALIVVGFLMMQTVTKIEWNNLLDAIPAFLAIVAMPFTYSISDGIGWGMISYAILHLCAGKGVGTKKEGAVHPVLLVVAILFILKYAFL